MDLSSNINLGRSEKMLEEKVPDNQPQIGSDKSRPPETLDEPVSETLMRDLRFIGFKLKYVMLPRANEEKFKELRKWDLWGPLLLCMSMAITLSISHSMYHEGDDDEDDDSAGRIFAYIFVIIWGGAVVVAVNAVLLGGKISFFQSVCVLGYSVFPLNLASLIMIFGHSWYFLVRLAIVMIGFFWSTVSTSGFMGALVSQEKKMLAVYPVCLFYLFIAWFIIVN